MANRYQSFSFTTASIASAATLQASQTLGPHVYNLVKLKIVRVTGNGNINFRIFKKGVWGSANRLIRFENQPVPLLHPVDQTSGAPGVEALEGVPLPIDDEDGANGDGTGKLHYELENLGTTSTFTITGEYEEVAVVSSAGDWTLRGTLTVATTSTPQFARLGLGAAADANHRLLVSSSAAGYGVKILDAAGGGVPVLNLSTTATSGGNIRNWLVGANYDAAGDFNLRCSTAEGGDPYSAGATRFRIDRTGVILPGADNAQDFGSASFRFKDGYFGGTLRFGTRSAIAAETVTGYITITDAGGTTRKLAVVS